MLPISTDVLELEITPNRPDCLAIYGVAREVHAATGAPLRRRRGPRTRAPTGDVERDRDHVECPDLCPRFTARVFEDVQIGPSPPWLKARLMAAGQRPISNVVDITNYVMLLTGQPLHAFDLDRVAGRQLTIRRGATGETVDTLDGQTRTLDDQMVLIADADGPTSIAGVMGGARSEVHDGTTRVLMEAANWNGPNIHRTSLRLGLRSEASARFEKQLQPEQAMEAQAVATALMIELCGARVLPGHRRRRRTRPRPLTIRLRDARVSGLLGAPIPRERCARSSARSSSSTADAADGLDVTVPTFRRGDVTREADLIEEVARLDGLEKLPATLPSRHGAAGRLTALQRTAPRRRDALAAQGLHEIVGWSFVGPDLAERLRLAAIHRALELENPMSTDQSQLRTTVLGLAARRRAGATARTAPARCGCSRPGAVYLPAGDGELPREPYHVGALLIGPVRPATWREPDPAGADFFAAKGVLGGLLDALRARGRWSRPPSRSCIPAARRHPGRRRAGRLAGGDPPAGRGRVGHRGHRRRVRARPRRGAAPGTPLYVDVTSFPEVREDLAVIVADDVAAADVLDVVRRAGAPLLARATCSTSTATPSGSAPATSRWRCG